VHAPAPAETAKLRGIKYLLQCDLYRLLVGVDVEKTVAVFGFDPINFARPFTSAPPFFRETLNRISFEILETQRFNHTFSRD
jgi:hypothetical protein